MKNALASFKIAAGLILKDKVNFLLALIPIVIGILIYVFLGNYIYESVMNGGKDLISQYVSEGTFGSVVYYIVATMLTVMLFFLVNWTFVLVVSLIASPFNDFMSLRIEKKLKGENLLSFSESFSTLGKNFFATWMNEIKKILFIVSLTLMSLLIGYIPLLTPVSILITVLLLSVGFLDFSWSRHELSFSYCLNDVRRNIFSYSFGGIFFFVLVSIPGLNLIVPPFGTSYFTVLWIKNNEDRNKVT